jgi:lysophospholipase L1-like esterase
MLKIGPLLCFLLFSLFACSKQSENNIVPKTVSISTDSIHYLALGDSYTIGTSIDFFDNYPNQTFNLLLGAGFKISAPQIVAKNGWTSIDLENAIVELTSKKNTYQLVTILIGVNNHYQDRSILEFESSFQSVLKSAIVLTGNNPKKVFVLSIPDWGITPFAAGRDKQKIATEIDAYNLICEQYAKKYGANFLNITQGYRLNGFKSDYLAIDGLHPSKLEYAEWSVKLAQQIINVY